MSHAVRHAHSKQVSVPIHMCVGDLWFCEKRTICRNNYSLENTGVGVEDSIGSVPAADNIGCSLSLLTLLVSLCPSSSYLVMTRGNKTTG